MRKAADKQVPIVCTGIAVVKHQIKFNKKILLTESLGYLQNAENSQNVTNQTGFLWKQWMYNRNHSYIYISLKGPCIHKHNSCLCMKRVHLAL